MPAGLLEVSPSDVEVEGVGDGAPQQQATKAANTAPAPPVVSADDVEVQAAQSSQPDVTVPKAPVVSAADVEMAPAPLTGAEAQLLVHGAPRYVLRPEPTVVRAHTPSVLEQLRDTVANSAVGHAVSSTMPAVADALDLHPSESENSPTYQQHKEQLLSPEFALPAAEKYLRTVRPDLAQDLLGPKHGIDQPNTPGENRAEGVARAAGGLTTAGNLGLMAVTGGASGLVEQGVSRTAAAVIGRLASGGVTLQMLKGLYDQHKQYRNAVNRGDTAEAQRIQGEMGVGGVMALLSAHHAVKGSPHPATTGEPPPPPPPPPAIEGSKPVNTAPPAVPPEVTPEGRAAGAATAQHPDMRPAMEQATNQHQAVGTEEPESKRTILQPTDNPAINQALATSGMPEFRAGLTDALKGIPGAELAADRDVKDPKRLAEKINQEGKPAETVSDYGGVQVGVDSPEARDQAVAAIKAKYPAVEEQDNFEKGDEDFGYRNHKLQVQLPSGVSVEVQVVPKEVLEANPEQHKDYERARAARISGSDAEFAKAAGEAKAKNDAAMAMFEARNEPETKPAKGETKALQGETKYKYGNTQANIPEDSEAHAALLAAAKKIDPADLNPTSYGGDEKGLEPDPHVTVRYGIQGEDTAAIEKFIRAQAPFEATLGKTSAFPPSKSSDGGAVIKADVESPELHRLNAEIEKHGDFAPSNFPDYKPHATVAYVKPEAVDKYVGMTETEGKTFPVRSIAITDRNGGAKEIPLEGGVKANTETKGGRGESPEPAAAGGEKPLASAEGKELSRPDHSVKDSPKTLHKGASVALPDGTSGTVAWSQAGKVRVKTADGGRVDIPAKEATPIPDIAQTGGKFTGVDLDKTLAKYDTFKGPTVIGEPIPAMVEHVKQMLADGKDVRIFTARLTDAKTPEERATTVKAIQDWTQEHVGRRLPVTNVKSPLMEHLIDDRAQGVVPNTGELQETANEDAPKPGEAQETARLSWRDYQKRRQLQAEKDAEEGRRQRQLRQDEARQRIGGEPESAKPEPEPQATAESEPPLKTADPLTEKREKFKELQAKFGATLNPGDAGQVPVRALHLDPKRFQYKVSNIGASGVTDLLAGNKWNPDLAGVVSVWRDPADGKIYVVNGHHRVDLAKRTGQAKMLVRMLEAKDAPEARAIGALQNIAEGRGTVIDAAKYFRDTGITPEELDAKGVSMGEATAQNGVALSRLARPLFDAVVQGKMSQGRGIAIGRETSDAATQEAILKLVDKAEKRGTKVTDGTVEELARFARTAPQRQETVGTLFGDEDRTESTALDKAAVSAYVLKELGADKRAFGAVATEGRAARLSADGTNTIDVAGNAEKAEAAEQAAEVYRRLSARRGPIDDILNRAAEERASAKPAEVAGIDRRAYDAVRAAVSEALSGGEGPGAGPGEADAGRGSGDEEAGPSKAELEAAGQGGFFSRRPKPLVESLALPGMEGDVEAQRESAAALKEEDQKDLVETALRTPAGDISKAAGEMERHSPLFFGTSASGQDTLFRYDSQHLPASVARQLSEALRRTTGQNLERATYRRATFDGGRPYLELDADAYYAFNRLTGIKDDYIGVLFGKADTDIIRQELDVQASRSTGVHARHIERMAKAFSGAANEYGHTILGAPGADVWTLLEENLHSWSIKFDLQPGLLREMNDGPFLDNARSALKEGGYPEQDAFTMVAESVAKAAANPHFLPLEQRRAILQRYAVLLAKHGVDLTYVPSTLDDVRDVFRGEGNARYQSKAGETDRGAYQAVRGLSEPAGRQGDDGAPAIGREVAGRGKTALSSRRPDDEVEKRLYTAGQTIREQRTAEADAKTTTARTTIREMDRAAEADNKRREQTPPAKPDWKSALARLRDRLEPKPVAEKPMVEQAKASTVASVKAVAEDAKAAVLAVGSAREKLAAAWADLKAKPKPTTDYMQAFGEYELARTQSALENQRLAEDLAARVPDKKVRIAISNWIQANGDNAKLSYWERNSKPALAEGYRMAQRLTADQKAIARDIKAYFDEQEKEAVRAGFIERGKLNYLMQIYDTKHVPELESLLNYAALNDKPGIFKRSTFRNYFEAESAGAVPRDKDIGYLVGVYDKVMGEAVRSRAFLKDLLNSRASDGRPVAILRRDGTIMQIGPENEPYLLRYSAKDDGADPLRTDYVKIDHPAMRRWLWEVGDVPYDDLTKKDLELYESDKSIAMKGDVFVHPEVEKHLRSMLGTSAVRKVPVARELLWTSQFVKDLMFTGSLTHQMIESTTAVMHGVAPINLDAVKKAATLQGLANPFRLDDSLLDLDRGPDAETKRLLVKNGLTLMDFPGDEAWSEGVAAGAMRYFGPAGKLLTDYRNFMFRDLIPKFKMAMALKAFERDRIRYGGTMDEDRIAQNTARQANASFGGINWRRMGVSQTALDVARLTLLAPDFQAGRVLQLAEALRPGGRQQMMVLARGAMVMWVTARMLNYFLNDGDTKNDLEHAFSIVYKGRSYGIRTPQGDLLQLAANPQAYIMHRLNPVLGRTGMEVATRKDEYGRAKTWPQIAKDAGVSALPIGVQGALKNQDMDWAQSFLEAMGIQDARYYTPAEQTAHKLRIGHLPQETEEDEAKQEASRKERHMEEKVRAGTMTTTDLWNAVKAGEITASQAGRIQDGAEMTQLEKDVKALGLKEALDVYEKANVAERADLAPILSAKADRLEAKTDSDDPAAMKKLGELQRRMEKLLAKDRGNLAAR